MKVCITSSAPQIDAEVDPRFGRCKYLLIVDTEKMVTEVIDNPGKDATSGAGITAAQVVVDKGIEAVLTGNCGPKAYQVLSSFGVKVVTGVDGKVEDALRAYQSGQLQESKSANVAAHSGI